MQNKRRVLRDNRYYLYSRCLNLQFKEEKKSLRG
jgi:hypothetical protein